MPWLETNVMEQRTLFIKAWLTQRYTKTALCRQFHISRPTADKWIARHFELGLSGLKNRSRKPLNSPNATPPWIVEWLVVVVNKFRSPH